LRTLSRLAAPLAACAALALAAPAGHAQRDSTRLRGTAADTARPDTARRDSARTVRVCAGGDVTLGTNLDTTWVWTAAARAGRPVAAFPDPDSLLAPLRPLVGDADIVLLNVEGAIGTGPAARKCAPAGTHCFAFRQPTGTAGALRRLARDSAVVVGNVANNHARDAGPWGVGQTVRHLRDAGVLATGADTLATLAVTSAGDTVAFLGFSQWNGPDPRDLAAVRRHVARAARRWPRLVVTMHMGAEGAGAQHTYDATERFVGENRGNAVAFAHAAVQAGAGLVIGAGPHVVRAVEQYRGGLIFYSLGNLVTYGPFSLGEPLNRGVIACTSIDSAGRAVSAVLRPTRQRIPTGVWPDPSGRAAALVDALGRADFPATGVPVGEDGALLLAPADSLLAARPSARYRGPGTAAPPRGRQRR
jgi:poly-gamma-glutamate capsule biosynthesis protein CapA/YwtB (metallophosphatase superfamily)